VLTTPDTIRTLQRKLYTKAKQEPAYRFYALYDKLYRADILGHAWRLVKVNKGSPGVDGISFEAIEGGIGVETFLRELAQRLEDQTYRAQPVRRVMIPKGDGSLRPLGIPTIRDRVDFSTRNKDNLAPGRLILRMGGNCTDLNDVKKHYPDISITNHPHGRSVNEETVYTAMLLVGKLNFGFAESNPQCLSSVSLWPNK
jgi:hypothetical protein